MLQCCRTFAFASNVLQCVGTLTSMIYSALNVIFRMLQCSVQMYWNVLEHWQVWIILPWIPESPQASVSHSGILYTFPSHISISSASPDGLIFKGAVSMIWELALLLLISGNNSLLGQKNPLVVEGLGAGLCVCVCLSLYCNIYLEILFENNLQIMCKIHINFGLNSLFKDRSRKRFQTGRSKAFRCLMGLRLP